MHVHSPTFTDLPRKHTHTQTFTHIHTAPSFIVVMSPMRHGAELNSWLTRQIGDKSIMFLYTDGGPDHRLTYVSTQLSLIALFLNLNLDLLCAARTAPNQSWRNPVERIMSVVNLGLQSIGLMRKEMNTDAEKALRNCNSLKQDRSTGEQYKKEITESIMQPIDLLSDIMQRLELKGKHFEVRSACSDGDIPSKNGKLVTTLPHGCCNLVR